MSCQSSYCFAPICSAVLFISALLVPRIQRREWLAEWSSELWYLLYACRHDAQHSRRAGWDAMCFCLGSFKDALWLRRSNAQVVGQTVWLRSPTHCLLFLSALAAATSWSCFWLPGIRNTVLQHPHTTRHFISGSLLVVAIALVVLPATTNLALGDYPATGHSPTGTARLRRWVLLATKFALILPIVFCGTLDLASIISRTGIQPHAMLVGYVLAFRWALIDQRRRCPVCLRLLTNPVRIGQPSHTFLDWYGTEFICSRGHGLLHVPEIPMTSFSIQRWLYLDPSWRSPLS